MTLGTIFLKPGPRCTPGRISPSFQLQGIKSGDKYTAKTDRAYAEVVVAIRKCPKKQFSHLNIPFPKSKTIAALKYLLQRGEIRVVKTDKYIPPFRRRRYPIRIYTKLK